DPGTIRGLRGRAAAESHVPVGFFAAITKGQAGEELAELGSLADAGAVGFTDDGHPVVAAGVMRRALQYNAITGRTIAVHCEEQTLTRGGHAHAGAVASELGIGGWPSLGESLMVARDIDLAADTGQSVHLMHLSARESVEHLRRGREAGVCVTGEASPHHLCLTDDAIRTLDPNFKMNPPLRTEDDRTALIDGLRDGTISAGPAVIFGLDRPRVAVGAPANLTLLDLAGSWRVRADGLRSRSQNSWLLGERLNGRVRLTIAAGRVAFE